MDELWINFASTQNVVRIPWHTVGIFAHPLQIVWIVTASFKLARVPRPKAFALSTEHLVAAFSFVNQYLAIRARFCVIFEKGDGCDSVGIAHVVWIVASGLEFSAVRASVFFACSALPRGRHEAIAFGIGAAMNELIGRA